MKTKDYTKDIKYRCASCSEYLNNSLYWFMKNGNYCAKCNIRITKNAFNRHNKEKLCQKQTITL